MAKKPEPVITHTEILARAARNIEDEIKLWERRAEDQPGQTESINSLLAPIRGKLEAVNLLYLTETGSYLI
jgi:hypothetical protein